jgi:hypothetical protein
MRNAGPQIQEDRVISLSSLSKEVSLRAIDEPKARKGVANSIYE